jgi:hypothetical protein
MRVLFERFVVDVEPGPGGVLGPRAGALPRREPATREGTVHRQLCALAGAEPSVIASFASTHGLLRRGAPWLTALRSPEGRLPAVAMGHQMADDLTLARTWLEGGGIGQPPAGVTDALAFAAAMAELPDAVHEGFALAVAGKPEAVVAQAVGDTLPDPAAFLQSIGGRIAPHVSGATGVLADRHRLLRGLEELEWFARELGEVDDALPWVSELGGARGVLADLLRNVPEALLEPALLNERNETLVPVVEALARETVEEWQEVAAEFATRCGWARLVRLAVGEGTLTRPEKARLATVYQDLAGFDAPASISVGELGERVLALLRADVEAALVADGVWPLRRGSVAGLLSRALVALWTELTDERPVVACATVGCRGCFALVHGRVYCDDCRTARRQEAVRNSRAKAADDLDAKQRPHRAFRRPSSRSRQAVRDSFKSAP